ncbi:MAG: hypothetical protein JO316_01260 [Abitibacteriaceae bacterium]|nr:hypothetical protein [Abditibacteriaceae bacterium]
MQHRQRGPQRQRLKGYPPRHEDYVRDLRRYLARLWLIFGGSSILLSYGYFHDWPSPLWELAPVAALGAVIVLLMTVGSLDDIRCVAILPYFKKGHPPAGSPTVRGDSFLRGGAVARACTYLDVLARQNGLEPLSSFGFADDLAGETVVWHDAARGLKTVSGLLSILRETPFLGQDTAAALEDLTAWQENLASATELQVPFCLLLRHSSTASGHEMDVRQGYFCYGYRGG